MLDNYSIEFDCYITSSNTDYGFGVEIANASQVAFISLNDYNRCTYRSATDTHDTYQYGSYTALTRCWVHFKYTIRNNTLTMEISKNNVVAVTISVNLDNILSSNTIKYRLMSMWSTGERYIKNIIVDGL